MRRLSRGISCGALLCMLAASFPAAAATFDLALDRLIERTPDGQVVNPSTSTTAQENYRQLASELGVALAPKILAPADSTGFSGFQLTFDYSFTTISSGSCSVTNCPWKGVEGAGVTSANLPSMLHVLSITARKGLWLPLPWFELGIGASKLLDSNIYGLYAYGKFTIHEGFHKWAPLPAFSLRCSGLRVLGAKQMDLTLLQVDATLSWSIGIASTLNLTPYIGAASQMTFARGQVIDATPTIDAYAGGPNSTDLNNNVVFPDQSTIVRWRFFGGLRLVWSYLVVTTDLIITACGDLGVGKCDHSGKTIADHSPNQYTYSASIGMLF